MGRNFIIAVTISLGLHVFFMTAVGIKEPSPGDGFKPYTRIDSLGPILKKTAFDIMLENADSSERTAYDDVSRGVETEVLLKAMPPGRRILKERFLKYFKNDSTETLVLDFLTDRKSVPNFFITGGR